MAAKIKKNICVFCSSSDAVEDIYFQAARDLGSEMVKQGYGLVFGAGRIGLMGALARAVHDNGGQVVGVIPEALNLDKVAYPESDNFIVTKDMRERKAIMAEHASAFIAMPGGFGTLEELLEIITLKQLGYHNKPIVVLNVNSFYSPLLEQFEMLYQGSFAKEGSSRLLFHIAPNYSDALSYLAQYQPIDSEKKWY